METWQEIKQRIGDRWVFPSDLPARRRYFHDEVFAHPAKLHLGLLQRLIDLYTEPCQTILDPMAGSGSLLLAAAQQRNVILNELVPDYVDLILRSEPIMRSYAGLLGGQVTVQTGDARYIEIPAGATVDHIITSPPYGFTEGTKNQDALAERVKRLNEVKHSKRWQLYIDKPTHATFANSFHYVGGKENTGNKTGKNYWSDMRLIYQRCRDLLPPGGLLILILKNHYRRGKLIDVTSQTVAEVSLLGFELYRKHERYINNPSLWQRRRREQGLPIVDSEDVLVFRRAR